MNIALRAFSLVEKVNRVQVASHYVWGTNGSKWIQDGCKVYMGSYMASNGSCFMATWIIFKKIPLGCRSNIRLGWPWHSETSQPLVYYILSWVRSPSHMTWHYTWGLVPTLHEFGSALGQLLDTSFGLSQFHGHNYWLACVVALSVRNHYQS